MEKILLNIDSRQRDLTLFPQSSYFKIEYNDDLNFRDKQQNIDSKMKYINNNYVNFSNIDYISLVTIEFPNNFYIFQNIKNNTSLEITCVNTDGNIVPDLVPGTKTVFIKEGNYENDELINNLNLTLNTNKFNIGTINDFGDFVITRGLRFEYDKNLNKYSLVNLEAGYTFSVNITNTNYTYNNLGFMLGFRTNIINLEQNAVNKINRVTGTSQADIEGEKYFFIKVNDYGQIFISPKIQSKALAKIVINNWKKTYIFNNASDLVYKTHKFRQPVDIKGLEIEILDYSGKRANFDGVDYSLTFEFGMIYDETIYNKQLKSLNLIPEQPIQNNKIVKKYTDKVSNIKSSHEILAPVYDMEPEMVQVQEIVNLEDQRSEAKKPKNNKFGFQYDNNNNKFGIQYDNNRFGIQNNNRFGIQYNNNNNRFGIQYNNNNNRFGIQYNSNNRFGFQYNNYNNKYGIRY
jgi:hypothetical protein